MIIKTPWKTVDSFVAKTFGSNFLTSVSDERKGSILFDEGDGVFMSWSENSEWSDPYGSHTVRAFTAAEAIEKFKRLRKSNDRE